MNATILQMNVIKEKRKQKTRKGWTPKRKTQTTKSKEKKERKIKQMNGERM